MRRVLFILFFAQLGFASCGVKAPPVAPRSPGETYQLNLNCSPYDPECDRTDPNYKPRNAQPSSESTPAPTRKKKR